MTYINREISWLAFNRRVLEEARDASVPLLERLKFLAITSSNMDEFFMVRMGGLYLVREENPKVRDLAGFTPGEQLDMCGDEAHALYRDMYACLIGELMPGLSALGITIAETDALTDAQHTYAENLFFKAVQPVITPLAVDGGQPFPLLSNLGLNVLVRLDGEDGAERFVVIPLGKSLKRVFALPSDEGHGYILLETIVRTFAQHLFPNESVLETRTFRITRNADMELKEEFAADLRAEMEKLLSERVTSPCVRLEVNTGISDTALAFIKARLEITDAEVYLQDGAIDLSCLWAVSGTDGFPDHEFAPLPPMHPVEVDPRQSMFESIAEKDILLYHPYESYEPVVRFLNEAADDPDVLAIKQILYRTSDNSPIVGALRRAVKKGKYVSVLVELKARFSEAQNIEWAKKLEEEGAHVVYGIKNYKIHAKLLIVVRQEPDGIVRYVHLATGNYNESTARIFSDTSLFTCNPIIAKDGSAVFNAITGNSQVMEYEKLVAAPTGLRDKFYELIEAEAERAKQGQKAEIIVKVNSLGDPGMIDAVYKASQAGVRVRVNVRGICCLKAGIPGVSDNIEVISILDRFLEHARVFYFYHGGEELLFISSADWLTRNLDRRVELMIPVESGEIKEKMLKILKTYFKDTVKARRMDAGGVFVRPAEPVSAPARSQEMIYDMLRRDIDIAEKTRRTTFEPYEAVGE